MCPEFSCFDTVAIDIKDSLFHTIKKGVNSFTLKLEK